MKYYMLNLLIITVITFGSILFWLIFNENSFFTGHQLVPRKNNYYQILDITKRIDNQPKTLKYKENVIAMPTQVTKKQSGDIDVKPPKVGRSKRLKNIICKINEEYDVNCLKYQRDQETVIFVPFNFIQKYFDVYGQLVKVNDKKSEYFEWNHSYSKVFYPDSVYNPKGKFLWFENYNVEIRDRVWCISAAEGVPISTQWHPDGHFYPTQIAQFGLSHFSRNLIKSTKQIALIGDESLSKHLTVQSGNLHSSLGGWLESQNNTVLLLSKKIDNYFFIDTQVKLNPKSSIVFVIEQIDLQEEFKLIFSAIDDPILSENNRSVTYGIGSKRTDWHNFTRDVLMDIYKGKLISTRKPSDFKFKRIELIGSVAIRKLSLLSNADHLLAISAGDWFVRHQNEKGGWEITVKRKLCGGTLVLDEGWHSAMAQGHAISLLTRLYTVTGDVKYLTAAKRAIQIFSLNSNENGVRTNLFDKFVWYEEYPTIPSIYVLNGFIYSLFGLYDLAESCDDTVCHKSRELFDDGLRSLESLLPLFDSGSGSFYDLRHLTMDIAPNLARWDYHSTHVSQLHYLNTIVHNDIFKNTADRWGNYMRGHRAAHN